MFLAIDVRINHGTLSMSLMRQNIGPGRPHISSELSFAATAGLTGALAQLGEHLLCKQGVIGSIPIRSTI
jgi:hypothetical protein